MKFSVLTFAGGMLAAIAVAAPVLDATTRTVENPADTDLPPVAYWVIAGHKRAENDLEDVKLVARAIDSNLANADLTEKRGNEIIAVSVVHAVRGDEENGVNAYSDYVEAADAKEILGE